VIALFGDLLKNRPIRGSSGGLGGRGVGFGVGLPLDNSRGMHQNEVINWSCRGGCPVKYLATMTIALLLVLPSPVLLAQNPVGIILGGHQENCEVTHSGKVYDCDERKELYMGDVIKKKPSVKAVKIKWAPYVKGAPRGEMFLEVVPNRPEKLKGDTFAGMAKQYIHDFIKPTEYSTTAAVTRDPKSKVHFPLAVSMLEGFPFLIPKGGHNVRSISIIDGKGGTVYQKQVNGESDLVLDISEVGLKPGDLYTAHLVEESETFKMKLFLPAEDLQK
jgi:hypothetical protein